MYKIIGFLMMIVIASSAATKKDFFGYWMIDMEKMKSQMSAKEKEELSKVPPAMLKIGESLIIKIEDSVITVFVMSEEEKGICQSFVVSGNQLKASCIQESKTLGPDGKPQKPTPKEMIATLDGKWLHTTRPTGGKGGQLDKLSLVKVDEAKAKSLIQAQPTKEDLHKMMMMMFQKALQEQSGN